MSSEAIGKTYAATVYAVSREKIREYAHAVGETNPLHLDVGAARAAGHADLVAPPMFAVVYAGPAVAAAFADPELGIDFARLVHGGQDFRWERLVVAGDELTTVATVTDVSERAGNRFFTFETVSADAGGDAVCVGTWTNIVRGA